MTKQKRHKPEEIILLLRECDASDRSQWARIKEDRMMKVNPRLPSYPEPFFQGKQVHAYQEIYLRVSQK
jgi:hypothetical protein